MSEQYQEAEAPRSGGLVSSQGIEWSLIWLAVGVIGMVILFFAVLGNHSTEQPTYDGDSHIVPRAIREAPERDNRPEVGTDSGSEST